MKISVIIPVYNTEKYLNASIDSVLSQTYKDIEVLLINDGSTDQSGEICESYRAKDSRINVYHQDNQGVSSARNLGLDNAKGDLLYFLDSDDVILPDFFEYAVRQISDFQGDIVFFTGSNEEDEIRTCSRTEALQMFSAFKLPTSLWSAIYRTKIIGSVRLNKDIHFYEDYEYIIRIIGNSKKIVITSLNFHIYNQREGSANHMPNINEKVITCLNIAESLKEEGILSKRQLKSVQIVFIQQSLFYFLRSAKFQANISRRIQGEAIKYFSYVIISKIKILHKILIFLFIFSPEITYKLVGPLYRGHLQRKLKQ